MTWFSFCLCPVSKRTVPHTEPHLLMSEATPRLERQLVWKQGLLNLRISPKVLVSSDYKNTHMHTYIHAYTRYTYTLIYIHIHTCTHKNTYAHIYRDRYTHTFKHTHTQTEGWANNELRVLYKHKICKALVHFMGTDAWAYKFHQH